MKLSTKDAKVTDGRWIASLCLARVGFALLFVAYPASLGINDVRDGSIAYHPSFR